MCYNARISGDKDVPMCSELMGISKEAEGRVWRM